MSGDGDREKGKRGKKRGNEEKTTVKRRFSPRLTERPADQPPEPAQHRQTRTAAGNAAFFGSAFVEYAESTEINASFDHTEGGDGSYFHDLTNAKNLALYPLLHASIFFTKPSPHKHTVHQRYISLQI